MNKRLEAVFVTLIIVVILSLQQIAVLLLQVKMQYLLYQVSADTAF